MKNILCCLFAFWLTVSFGQDKNYTVSYIAATLDSLPNGYALKMHDVDVNVLKESMIEYFKGFSKVVPVIQDRKAFFKEVDVDGGKGAKLDLALDFMRLRDSSKVDIYVSVPNDKFEKSNLSLSIPFEKSLNKAALKLNVQVLERRFEKLEDEFDDAEDRYESIYDDIYDYKKDSVDHVQDIARIKEKIMVYELEMKTALSDITSYSQDVQRAIDKDSKSYKDAKKKLEKAEDKREDLEDDLRKANRKIVDLQEELRKEQYDNSSKYTDLKFAKEKLEDFRLKKRVLGDRIKELKKELE